MRARVKDQFKGYNKRKGREAALWMELKNRDDIRSVKDALPRAVFGVSLSPALLHIGPNERRNMALRFRKC